MGPNVEFKPNLFYFKNPINIELPVTVMERGFRGWWEVKDVAVRCGGGFWVSNLKTTPDQASGTRWVRTRGGAATATSATVPEHLGEEKDIPMPKSRETEAQHHLPNRSRSFQSQKMPPLPLPNRFCGAKSHQRRRGWRQIPPVPSVPGSGR